MALQAADSDQYTRGMLEAIDGDPVVLNLGCGTDDEGIGVDIHYDPEIEYDLNDGIPVVDGAADRIIANHIIEHLNNPLLLLAEAQRVLRPGGQLHMEVPNAGWLPVRLWISQDMHGFWQHKDPDKPGHWLARRLGNPDPERTPHRTLWTKALLGDHLDRAGFDYSIEGRHWSRNFVVTACPDNRDSGQTLHELERAAGGDLAAGDYWAQTRSRIMAKWVDEFNPDRVLDVGCGSGYLTARIADETGGREVVGVDISEESIAVARQRETNARFEVANAFDLDYASGAFDLLVFGDVLEHFDSPARLLTATRPLLADRGHIIVSVPAFRWLFGPHDDHNDHYDRYTAGRLADIAGSAGYTMRRSTYTNLVPLVPYWLYQRVLERPVPSGARGGHSRLVEAVKRVLIGVETEVRWPVGVTLIAEFARDD